GSRATESAHPPVEHAFPPEQCRRSAYRKERAKRDSVLPAAKAGDKEGDPDNAAEDDGDEEREEERFPAEKGAQHRAELQIPAAHAATAHEDDRQEEGAREDDA